MVDYFIKDKDGNSIDSFVATVPSDRHFRNAWSLDGTVISIDLTVAKTLFKDKIRDVRTPLLEAEDIVYMRAIEDSDTDAQTASKNKKQALRDATAASAITDAANITALKSAWDTSLLGTSPYIGD